MKSAIRSSISSNKASVSLSSVSLESTGDTEPDDVAVVESDIAVLLLFTDRWLDMTVSSAFELWSVIYLE